MWNPRKIVPGTREFAYSESFRKKATRTGGVSLSCLMLKYGIPDFMLKYGIPDFYLWYEYKIVAAKVYISCN